MTPEQKATLRLLRAGRARIVQGWCQGDFVKVRNGQKAYCALGALRPSPLLIYEKAISPLSAIVREIDPSSRGLVSVYNDTPGRRKTHILALYDRAILAVKAGFGVVTS